MNSYNLISISSVYDIGVSIRGHRYIIYYNYIGHRYIIMITH